MDRPEVVAIYGPAAIASLMIHFRLFTHNAPRVNGNGLSGSSHHIRSCPVASVKIHFRLVTHNPPRAPGNDRPGSSRLLRYRSELRLAELSRAGGSGAMADLELSAEALRERLRKELGAEHVEVEDTAASRCACSFRVLVVAAAFRGMGLLQRHRLVNAALGAALGRIHALEQRTLTPEQWAAEMGAGSA